MEKSKHLIIQAALVISIFFIYYIEFSREKFKIIESLKSLSPLFLEIIFLIFVFLLIVSFKDIINPFKSVKKKNWIFVVLVLVFSFFLALFVSPKTHRIYYDENIYLHIGQSIAYTQKAQMVNFGEIKYGELIVNQGEYNKQPNGYPYFLSIFYRVFGCSENLSFLINNFVYSLSSLIIFLISFLLFRSFKIGIYSSIIFAVLPQNIQWHNTTSVEPSNTLFLSLTILIFLIFLESKKMNLFFLSVISACFASQFRIESILIFPLMCVILLIKNPKYLREKKLYYAIPLILILILPHLLHIYCFLNHPWGGSLEKYSLSFFGHNLKTNGLFFLNNKDFPVVFTIFLFIGFFSKNSMGKKMKLFIWFLFFWGVYIFFYAGSYYYGADMRFVLMAFPAFSILVALGFSNFDDLMNKFIKKNIFISLIIIFFTFISFLPKSRAVTQEAWAARADHHYAREMLNKLPKNSIIFTHNPNMFLFWGQSSAQASILSEYDEKGLSTLKNNFPGGIYFHYNFWCNVDDPLQQNFCKDILKKFTHEEILKFQERHYKYILYKIE